MPHTWDSSGGVEDKSVPIFYPQNITIYLAFSVNMYI